MSDLAPEPVSLPLKILYTLFGTESQKYIVKPPKPFPTSLFREIGIGTVDIKLCLNAICDASPDFAAVCETHRDEYAVYSIDYAEDEQPLQSHGRISQKDMLQVTGKIGSSRLLKEFLEVQVHLLPVRSPPELMAEFASAQKLRFDIPDSASFMSSDVSRLLPPPPMSEFPPPPASLLNPTILTGLPALPAPVHIPPSLMSESSKLDASKPDYPRVDHSRVNLRPDMCPPSSPPATRASSIPNSTTPCESTHSASSSDNLLTCASRQSISKPNSAPYNAKRAFTDGSFSKRRRAALPNSDYGSQCSNCGVGTSSTWRRFESSEGQKLLCNACGLYYRTKHVMRPSALWEKRTDPELESDCLVPKPRTRAKLRAPPRSRANMSTNTPTPPETAAGNATHINLPSSSVAAPNQCPSSPQQLYSTDSLGHSEQPQFAPDATLWSQGAAYISPSDPVDIADRLLDRPETEVKLPALAPSLVPASAPERPKTPVDQLTTSLPPDSIQKLFNINTPDQLTSMGIAETGSANKWLKRVMDSTSFEDLLRTPTPGKHRPTDLSLLTSSPPTSSNMFSEIGEWNMYGPSTEMPSLSLKPARLFREDTIDQPL